MSRAWFELKLVGNQRTVHWTGTSGEDAARRYVDAHRDATVIAYRADRRPQIRVGILVEGGDTSP
jgi:hypothetical protein